MAKFMLWLDGRTKEAKFVEKQMKPGETLSSEKFSELMKLFRNESGQKFVFGTVEGRDYYPKDLIEKIRNEYEKNSKIFKNDFIYRSIYVHDRTKKTLDRYDDKLLMLPENIVYYIDQSKLYENGKNKSWNAMNKEKFERENRIYNDKYNKLDPHYHIQKYEIVLDCENIGIFVFDSDEIGEYFDRCNPTSTGCISWNVVLEKDGEIFIRFNKDFRINVTKRRNVFDKLIRNRSDGINEDRRLMT